MSKIGKKGKIDKKKLPKKFKPPIIIFLCVFFLLEF